ncbi:MAG: hypothetical protein IJE43_05135 [Alphaproteobacteria bacterium]|nr:hypothetical protein [Alphaproteobacteria bacterium]
MKKFLLVVLCFLNFNVSYANNIVENNQDGISQIVQKFKDAVKTDNPQIIAEYVEYPYVRKNPLPDIEHKEDFINNYEMIFDDELKQAINDSKIEDWAEVGWRGIMLYGGMLWLSDDGKLKATNYYTDKAREYVAKWYDNDENKIYESLRKYNNNIVIFKTDTKLGRIDEINTDEYYDSQYRLALWDKNGKMSDKPEILISDGIVEYYGTANNTEYHFKSEDYEYVFFVNYVGPMDMKPYEFGVYKNNEELDYKENITFEEAYIVK